MADANDKQYDIEPDPDPPMTPERPVGKGIPRPEHVEPLRVETGEADDADLQPKSVKDLDVCPSCGAAMRGADRLLCMRCGFNLKTMQHVRTTTGEASVSAAEATGELEAIIKPGVGAFWLPTIIAATAGVILLVGYFAGVRSLYPAIVASTPADQPIVVPFASRINAVLQLLVLVGMLTACGIGALAFFAFMNGKRLAKNWDDLQLGAVRMVAIVACMRLAAFLALPQRGLENVAEALLQLGVFAALSIALFRLPPRDAPILTGAMAMLFILLWLSGWVIVWATW